jgi:nitrate reductase delta subunit
MRLLSRRDRVVAKSHDAVPMPVVLHAASMVLAYPDQGLLDHLETVRAALAGTPAEEQFAPVLAHLGGDLPGRDGDPGGRLAQLQAFHVTEFDLSRKHSLHLSYWTDGDTRRRGAALVDVQRVYRESGLGVDMAGELPDYLPLMLEFAAAAPEAGLPLLQRFRASLELIRLGLEADAIPHAGVVAAVCACLPGEPAQTRAEVQARFGDVQPIEFVGLSESARG